MRPEKLRKAESAEDGQQLLCPPFTVETDNKLVLEAFRRQGKFDDSERDIEYEETLGRVEWVMIEKKLYRYDGEVKYGTEVRHGWGTCAYRMGDQYWGYWRDGKIEGRCRYIEADGAMF